MISKQLNSSTSNNNNNNESNNLIRKWRITVLISGSGSNLGALITELNNKLSNCSIVSVISSKSTAYGLIRAKESKPFIPNQTFSLIKFKKQQNLIINKEESSNSNSNNELKEKIRKNYDIKLAKIIKESKPDLVILAGWMLILSEEFLLELKRDWNEEEELNINTSSSSTSNNESDIKSLSTPGSSPYPLKIQSNLYGKTIPIINLHPALPGTFPGAHAIQDAFNNFNAPPSPPSSPVITATTTTTSTTTTLSETLETLSLSPPSPPSSSSSSPSCPSLTKSKRITKTGIMIHKVIPLLDAGEPIIIKEIEMIKGESLEDLEIRIHQVEHIALVEAVVKIVKILGGKEEEGCRTNGWWDDE